MVGVADYWLDFKQRLHTTMVADAQPKFLLKILNKPSQ